MTKALILRWLSNKSMLIQHIFTTEPRRVRGVEGRNIVIKGLVGPGYTIESITIILGDRMTRATCPPVSYNDNVLSTSQFVVTCTFKLRHGRWRRVIHLLRMVDPGLSSSSIQILVLGELNASSLTPLLACKSWAIK